MDPSEIRRRLETIATSEAGLDSDVAGQVAFHLTDWLESLQAFHRFCENPDAVSTPAADKMLIDLLSHAPNHLAAAAKLYADLPVSDVFGVGAIETQSGADG